MHWTDDDPGLGELDGLEHRTRQLRQREEHAAEMVSMLGKSGTGIAEFWSGDAADEWADRIRDDLRHYSHLNESAERQCAAVLAYVDAVQTIKRQVVAARGRLGDAQDATAALQKQQDPLTPQQQSRLDDAADDARAAHRALAQLADERREADHILCSRLRSLSDVVRASAPVTAFNGSSLRSLSPEALLKKLSRLDDEQVMAVLDEHPELVSRLESATPQDVSTWWESLSPDRQGHLVESAPQLIGNLDGVAFTARDAANRLTLASELVSTRAELAAAKKRNASVAPAHRWETGQLEERLGALEAVQFSAGRRGGTPERFIVLLDLLGRPKAAVATGDLDEASQVTITVPGMGTTVAGSMRAWTAAAGNLFAAQGAANATYNGDREPHLATVAWIGYDAPEMPPSGQVLGNSKAREGGARLSRFLEGITATRGWPEGKNLSVVAHSYGTTTAAFALAKTKVESFTMLGSAGLAQAKVDQLKVDSRNVWATEADGDGIADFGRINFIPYSPPGFTFPFTHVTDPTRPGFGGNVFSSEASSVAGHGLYKSDGHSATRQIDMALAGHETTQHGYLDSDTTTLFNASLTTLGLGDSGHVIEK